MAGKVTGRSKNRKQRKRKGGKNKTYAKDKTPGIANLSSKILNIAKVNDYPIPMSKKLTLRVNSFMALQGVTNAINVWYVNLASLYDPNAQSTETAFQNRQSYGYTEWFGTAPLQYTKFRLDYVDVTIRCMNCTSGTIAQLVVNALRRTTDINTTMGLYNLANRKGSLTKSLEYFGDTQYQTIRFRVYPWEIMGIPKKEYQTDISYEYDYNIQGTYPPFLCLTVGDGAAPLGQGSAVMVRGTISLEQHVTALKPNVALSDGTVV